MNRHATPLLCLLLLLVTGWVESAPLPNILLIVADDLGYSDLGCYGGEIDTPNIDRLAAEGIRFTEFHVNPMCVVTRTSLMTGHTHSQSDNYRRSLPIARLMQQAGYVTSITGKWHQPGNPVDAGFDSFYGFLQGQIDSWTGWQRGKPTIQVDREEPQPVPDGWYSSDAFTDNAIAQIDAAQEEGNRNVAMGAQVTVAEDRSEHKHWHWRPDFLVDGQTPLGLPEIPVRVSDHVGWVSKSRKATVKLACIDRHADSIKQTENLTVMLGAPAPVGRL